jgi:O-antigen ligase
MTFSVPSQENPKPASKFTIVVLCGLMCTFLVGITIADNLYYPMRHINRVVGALLVLLALHYYINRKFSVPVEVALYLFFICWSGITGLAVAVDTNLLIGYLQLLIQLWFLIIAATAFAMLQGNLVIHFFSILFTGMYMVTYSFLSGDYQSAADAEAQVRASSIVSNANSFASYLLYGTMGLFYFFGTIKTRFMKPIILIIPPVFALGLVISGSRKSFIALFFFLLAWMWYCYRKKVLRNLSSFLLIVLLIIGVVLLTEYMYTQTFMGERFRRNLENPEVDTTRKRLYMGGFEVFIENPIAGVGLGNYTIVSGLGKETHSDYMEILATTGLVGAMIFFPIYLIIWLRLSKLRKQTTDSSEIYSIGIFKAILLTLLLLGFGRPNFNSIPTIIILSGIIGYTKLKIKQSKVSPDLPFKKVQKRL